VVPLVPRCTTGYQLSALRAGGSAARIVENVSVVRRRPSFLQEGRAFLTTDFKDAVRRFSSTTFSHLHSLLKP
jgi:hypothetical protein